MTGLNGIQTKADEVTFSWSPPYTIDDVPILGYESDILIFNDSNRSLINAYHTYLNDTSLIVPKPASDSNCVYVNVSVSAVNSVGYGETVQDIFYFSEGTIYKFTNHL